ncbi:hypothetical protein HK100_008123 [Physocladia obscura]|uniref:Inner centromere protein ARK-binding domain-containing protein n=1 Tax=Physocladia obscura TaxID=109957 RepID=A0AAD5TA51_9FUNG|nr:hypothetical protein HK100_008123 [Physocladia obscura]
MNQKIDKVQASSTQWINENSRQFRRFGNEAITVLADSMTSHAVWLAAFIDDIEEAENTGNYKNVLFTPGRPTQSKSYRLAFDSSDEDESAPNTAVKLRAYETPRAYYGTTAKTFNFGDSVPLTIKPSKIAINSTISSLAPICSLQNQVLLTTQSQPLSASKIPALPSFSSNQQDAFQQQHKQNPAAATVFPAENRHDRDSATTTIGTVRQLRIPKLSMLPQISSDDDSFNDETASAAIAAVTAAAAAFRASTKRAPTATKPSAKPVMKVTESTTSVDSTTTPASTSTIDAIIVTENKISNNNNSKIQQQKQFQTIPSDIVPSESSPFSDRNNAKHSKNSSSSVSEAVAFVSEAVAIVPSTNHIPSKKIPTNLQHQSKKLEIQDEYALTQLISTNQDATKRIRVSKDESAALIYEANDSGDVSAVSGKKKDISESDGKIGNAAISSSISGGSGGSNKIVEKPEMKMLKGQLAGLKKKLEAKSAVIGNTTVSGNGAEKYGSAAVADVISAQKPTSFVGENETLGENIGKKNRRGERLSGSGDASDSTLFSSNDSQHQKPGKRSIDSVKSTDSEESFGAKRPITRGIEKLSKFVKPSIEQELSIQRPIFTEMHHADSDEDVDMSIEEDVGGEEESGGKHKNHKILVENTQWNGQMDIEDKIDANKNGKDNDDEFSGTQSIWSSGIMKIGEKIVSNLTSFLPSPSKGANSASFLSASTATGKDIVGPSPLSKYVQESSAHKTTEIFANPLIKTARGATSSKLAFQKTGVGIGGGGLQRELHVKELEKRRQVENERRAMELKLQEEDIRRKMEANAAAAVKTSSGLGENKKPKEIDASKKTGKPKLLVNMAKKNASPDIASDDADMELCSQQSLPLDNVSKIPPSTANISKPDIPALATKPSASASQNLVAAKLPVPPWGMPASVAAMTDFTIPMTGVSTMLEKSGNVLEVGTPKELPRFNPKPKMVAQAGILKNSTPSFDARLAEKQKENAAFMSAAEIAGISNNGSGSGSDSKDILGGMFIIPAPVKKLPKEATKIGKKSSDGPATIVDENGELPEIPDTDDEDDDSSEDDQQQAVQQPKTPIAVKSDQSKSVIPSWVQTPNLMQSLTNQISRDPTAIFGTIQPLSLEDVFKERLTHRKFRDSMAGNWVGYGELTPEEEEAYRQKMGYE